MLKCRSEAPLDWLIIDGAYLCWRSFHASPKLTTSSGIPTGAVHGFLGAIRNTLKETRAKQCVIAWEGGTGNREAIFPSYKADRQEMPNELGSQFQVLFKLCPLLGWPIIQQEGLEADDVIFNLLSTCTGKRAIFTTDKDIISLVDENTLVFKKDKGTGWYLTAEDYEKKWGVKPSQIPYILALCGDAIDGIPGVDGIGTKTATKLIQQYGTLENLLRNQDSLPEKIRTKLETQSEILRKSWSAIQLIAQPVNPNTLDPKPDIPKALDILKSLEMHTTVKHYENNLF